MKDAVDQKVMRCMKDLVVEIPPTIMDHFVTARLKYEEKRKSRGGS